jgi:hypothetical protein
VGSRALLKDQQFPGCLGIFFTPEFWVFGKEYFRVGFESCYLFVPDRVCGITCFIEGSAVPGKIAFFFLWNFLLAGVPIFWLRFQGK